MAVIPVTASDVIDWVSLLSRFVAPTGGFTATINGEKIAIGSCVCVTEQERQAIVSILQQRTGAAVSTPGNSHD